MRCGEVWRGGEGGREAERQRKGERGQSEKAGWRVSVRPLQCVTLCGCVCPRLPSPSWPAKCSPLYVQTQADSGEDVVNVEEGRRIRGGDESVDVFLVSTLEGRGTRHEGEKRGRGQEGKRKGRRRLTHFWRILMHVTGESWRATAAAAEAAAAAAAVAIVSNVNGESERETFQGGHSVRQCECVRGGRRDATRRQRSSAAYSRLSRPANSIVCPTSDMATAEEDDDDVAEDDDDDDDDDDNDGD
ncbi:unnamed protein product, partial [Protopolystoma xenopodis]